MKSLAHCFVSMIQHVLLRYSLLDNLVVGLNLTTTTTITTDSDNNNDEDYAAG